MIVNEAQPLTNKTKLLTNETVNGQFSASHSINHLVTHINTPLQNLASKEFMVLSLMITGSHQAMSIPIITLPTTIKALSLIRNTFRL